MARKVIKIDWALVNRMLKFMTEGTDIAARLGISPDTLYRACQREHKIAWQEYAAAQFADTRLILREMQFNKAVGYKRKESKPFNTSEGVVFHDVIVHYEPSDTMLKWLGIQYLNQKDKQDITLEIPDFIIVGDSEDFDDEEPDEDQDGE